MYPSPALWAAAIKLGDIALIMNIKSTTQSSLRGASATWQSIFSTVLWIATPSSPLSRGWARDDGQGYDGSIKFYSF